MIIQKPSPDEYEQVKKKWDKRELEIDWELKPITDCFTFINITPNTFIRGWDQIDEHKKYLWNSTYSTSKKNMDNLYYCYALDLTGAIQSKILHEYAHFIGMIGHDPVNEYVCNTIIEMRKKKLGLSHEFRTFHSFDLPECGKEFFHGQISLTHKGSPPTKLNLPPGMKIRIKKN